MDSRTAGALAAVGVGLACGGCCSPPPAAPPEPRTPSPSSEEEEHQLQLQRTPEATPKPVLPPRREPLPAAEPSPLVASGQTPPSSPDSLPGGVAPAESPQPARRRREPIKGVVVEDTPLRSAIGRFCPIVEELHVGDEISVETEASDKRQAPWLSATTARGASGWLPKSTVRLPSGDGAGAGGGESGGGALGGIADTELEAHFEFRALSHEGELEAWLDLVCEVFGDLNIPRSYFARHWSSDPPGLRKLSGVLVAVERRSNKMVATVRIFRRTIRLAGGKQITVGGLGEVSTLTAYRGRGICTRLLKMSLAEMARSGIKASSLHAASQASAIYRRLGWQPVPMPTLTLPLQYGGGHSGGCAAPVPHYTVRELSWEQEGWPAVIARLAPLNASFMSALEGSFVRSEEYWATWIHAPAEALDSAGFPTKGVMRGWEVLAEEEDGDGLTVVAYAIFKRAGSFSSGAETAAAAGQGQGQPGAGARGAVAEEGTAVSDDTAGGGPPPRGPRCRCGLTLMDYASQAEAGSRLSEGWLMHLAAVASRSYYSRVQISPTTAVLGHRTSCQVLATLTVSHTHTHTCHTNAQPRTATPALSSPRVLTNDVCIMISVCVCVCVCVLVHQCPSLLAPGASRPEGGGEPSPQGEWMYCDVQAANAGMPAIVNTSPHHTSTTPHKHHTTPHKPGSGLS
jgi:hypothetical protein